jgi:hypothetical protein
VANMRLLSLSLLASDHEEIKYADVATTLEITEVGDDRGVRGMQGAWISYHECGCNLEI